MNRKKNIARIIEGYLEHRDGKDGVWSKYLLFDQTHFVSINKRDLNRAMLGDFVSVRYRYRYNRNKELCIGVVEKILRRSKKPMVATLVNEFNGYYYYVKAKGRTKKHLTVNSEDLQRLNLNQRVLIRFKDWPVDSSYPTAEFLSLVADKIENTYKSTVFDIAMNCGFSRHFPDLVLEQARSIPTKITYQDIVARRDYRNVLTFTIDQETAKDLDDAISYRTLSNNIVEIGVHIADVTHYVSVGSAIDEEGKYRGTSVYFANRVIPMLPEILSNQICSLNPNEDKLTLSAVFQIDQTGCVIKEWYGETIINSNHRLSYQFVDDVLNNKVKLSDNGEHFLDDSLNEALLRLNQIASSNRNYRMNNGSLMINTEEINFKLGKDFIPTEIGIKSQSTSNYLIEELMLLANKSVANYLHSFDPHFSTVYRVHDLPDKEVISSIISRIKKLGYVIDEKSPKNDLNKVLEGLRGTPHQYWISTMITKSMSKANYSTQNIGHYGLGFDYYTHFTSPIRRYPDVMVHRLLKEVLKKQKPLKVASKTLEEDCVISNQQEINAMRVEREVNKFLQCLYIEHVADKSIAYDAVVSGIASHGLFVEIIENKCQGMVYIGDLGFDWYYQFDKNGASMIQEFTGKKFQLGDMVKVKIKSVTIQKYHINFILVSHQPLKLSLKKK